MSTTPLEPSNRPYGVAKLAGVEMCWAFNRRHGTQFIPAMPTNFMARSAAVHRPSRLPARRDDPRHLEPRRAPAVSRRDGRTQEHKASRRHRTLARALRLPPGDPLQCRYLSRLARITRPAVPPPGSDPDSGQRLLPPGRRGPGLVQMQPPLAGSAPVAALLAGLESHRKAAPAHPQERDAPSLLGRRERPVRQLGADLRGNAVPPRTDPVLRNLFLSIAMSL